MNDGFAHICACFESNGLIFQAGPPLTVCRADGVGLLCTACAEEHVCFAKRNVLPRAPRATGRWFKPASSMAQFAALTSTAARVQRLLQARPWKGGGRCEGAAARCARQRTAPAPAGRCVAPCYSGPTS